MPTPFEGNNFFALKQGGIYGLPILHHTMEMAAQVRLAFQALKPDCVAVELPQALEDVFLRGASRLPDISVILRQNQDAAPLYYLCEPCDPSFEALRSALEAGIPGFCIDLDLQEYPDIKEPLPDPYVVHRIGLKPYYDAYKKVAQPSMEKDNQRELHMAQRLKELTFSYDTILFVSGMAHVERVLHYTERSSFPSFPQPPSSQISLCTLTEKSCREVLPEYGWIARHYEETRSLEQSHFIPPSPFPPDRQKLLYQLYKEAGREYQQTTGNPFERYHLWNTMKFVRNYALISQRLLPDLFQVLSAAKGCVEHNYAYEVWELATAYPYLKNVDNLPTLDLSIEDIWGAKKLIRFHRKQQQRKGLSFRKKSKDRRAFNFIPPNVFSICSYPKEDVVIENFGEFLKKKSMQIASEEGARTIPFSTSLEDGLDVKETIRHWHESRLYVKAQGKPPGKAGSIVVIFNEDTPQEGQIYEEKYPWRTTWIGEHNQESDMALYATDMKANVIGPGISRCEYGGFMMTSPPRRLYDVWSDPDYSECRSKAEVLLMAAIDYSVERIIVYVSDKPPRNHWKNYASRYGKKLIYLPIGQLSKIILNKIRTFHVLDGHNRRSVADEYITG